VTLNRRTCASLLEFPFATMMKTMGVFYALVDVANSEHHFIQNSQSIYCVNLPLVRLRESHDCRICLSREAYDAMKLVVSLHDQTGTTISVP
jgi:hypothetical protein